MALDTYEKIWRRVLLRTGNSVSSLLARDWVSNAFREVSERRLWSWQTKAQEFQLAAQYNTGTVALTGGSTTVTGTGTVWTAANTVGRQFRSGTNNPVYTVLTRNSNTEILLDRGWGGSTATGSSYQIFDGYVTVPSDFLTFVSAWDMNYNYQLGLHLQQEDLNRFDAQRSNSGVPYFLVQLDYDTASSPPLPRYEVWPHQFAQYTIPYLYKIRATDLEDSGAELPRLIRGDLLLEHALAQAALYPGTPDAPNRYESNQRHKFHLGRFERMLVDLERQDNEIFQADVHYSRTQGFSPVNDVDWLQTHDDLL